MNSPLHRLATHLKLPGVPWEMNHFYDDSFFPSFLPVPFCFSTKTFFHTPLSLTIYLPESLFPKSHTVICSSSGTIQKLNAHRISGPTVSFLESYLSFPACLFFFTQNACGEKLSKSENQNGDDSQQKPLEQTTTKLCS